MRPTIDETKHALNNPAVRANVLREVREALWSNREQLGFVRSRVAKLDEELQSPAMVLYERGRCEIVAPTIGSGKEVELSWSDLRVNLVSAAGRHMTAGKVVWSAARPSRPRERGSPGRLRRVSSVARNPWPRERD